MAATIDVSVAQKFVYATLESTKACCMHDWQKKIVTVSNVGMEDARSVSSIL